VAARLEREHPDATVIRERGRLLELSVETPDGTAYAGGPLAYPSPKSVVAKVDRALSARREPGA